MVGHKEHLLCVLVTQDSEEYQALRLICGIEESQKLTCYSMGEVPRGNDGEGKAMTPQIWYLRNYCKYKVCGK